MLQFTMFGGTEGELPPGGFSAVTLFGGAELRRPTLARRLLALKNHNPDRKRTFRDRLAGTDRGLVLTVFGGTEIAAPSLVEEYTALRSMIRSRTLEAGEIPELIGRLLTSEQAGPSRPPDDWIVLTFFGATTIEQVPVERERKELEAAERNGLITRDHRRALEDAIGAPEASSAELIGRLATQPA